MATGRELRDRALTLARGARWMAYVSGSFGLPEYAVWSELESALEDAAPLALEEIDEGAALVMVFVGDHKAFKVRERMLTTLGDVDGGYPIVKVVRERGKA